MSMAHQDETISLQYQQPPMTSLGKPLSPRSALAATYSTYVVRVHTRHGIKTISFDLLAGFFTYTAKKAAEDLGISSRTLIRVCRSLGIRRWPYLGFRSEKNVERIRQEAIENLRRKLEREGPETASSVHPDTTCLRGASAKRLLQVKLPQVPSLPKAAAPRMRMAASDLASFYRRAALHRRCVHTVVSPSASAPAHMGHHAAPHPMLLTPPTSHHTFNLEMSPSMSPPRRSPAVMPFHSKGFPRPSPSSSPVSTASTASSSSVPSLNVLVDASILTAFKHEVETHIAHNDHHQQQQQAEAYPRTMSMRDILSHTAMSA
ncbi:hypothetical protein Poli38472_012238 [Pythium oligandrum]|uniref:RWP-RK domain-containing protein n=1 Tax=Pythium oligandrum TaxID=41045 RepID=A0A8K1CR27_PYTOL|nr:hypothetical protein Poli38472_012238 [Pythium oligandrum]|eukprot:TMW67122.1 hypothetical protein Poli38472_012238 [Pythium oligandrum]